MKHALYAAVAALALAAGAQAQQTPPGGAPLPHINPPPPPAGCAEALAPLPGKWEWQERAGARPFFMEISPGKDECSLDVQALWPQSLAARYFWQFTVRWDAASKSYAYTSARHWHEPAIASEGEQPKQDVKYEDGSGALRLEGDTLRWDERKEGICKACRFTKTASAVQDGKDVPDALAFVAAQDIAAVLRDHDSYGSYLNGEAGGALGVIGTDGKRFQIRFTSVQRSADNPLLYNVKGKTRAGGTGGNVCDFTGTVEVQRASLLPRTAANAEHYGDYEAGTMRGNIEARMELEENREQSGSGAIQGTLRVDVLHGEGGSITADHTMLGADGYANSQFTGSWTGYKTGARKPLNFGALRIPHDGLPDALEIDTGVGEFVPADKLAKNSALGWTDYRTCMFGMRFPQDYPDAKGACERERRQWWQ